MSQPVKIALAGCGGYGRNYWRHLLDPPPGAQVRIAGLIDPRMPQGPDYERSRAMGIPMYEDLHDFYANDTAELMILATPIHLHAPQTIYALEHGSNVLCEKPLAATVQDALNMQDAERRAGKFVAIGYQASFSDAVQSLKKDIMSGALGRPLNMKTLYFWPRTAAYYGRNNWAGAERTADGAMVLDSPANNATAHFLHNMFYVLGAAPDTSAAPVEIQAECYRANAIDNYDTVMLRCRTAQDVEIMFYSSHAVPSHVGPIFRYEFEEACVTHMNFPPHRIIARRRDGAGRDYGTPFGNFVEHFGRVIAAARSGERPVCGIAAAMAQTICINGIQESTDGITPFPEDIIRRTGTGSEQLTWVEPLQAAMLAAYDLRMLPSELGAIPWARPGRPFDLRDYRAYPSKPRS